MNGFDQGYKIFISNEPQLELDVPSLVRQEEVCLTWEEIAASVHVVP